MAIALKAIAGFLRPSEGRIAIDGRDVTHEPPNKRGIGVVVQNGAGRGATASPRRCSCSSWSG